MVSGSGIRDSSTWDAEDSVTHSAVKSAARSARRCAAEMSIAAECAMGGVKWRLRGPEAVRTGRSGAYGTSWARGPYRPGIRPLRKRSTKIW
ncbi:hypothetical protein Sliba_57430 [Streptomyces nigrescens]|uniref:Uncharacterized protein n=1 Tax=Streptomyces nigrescens TaxID=1920 RepID=A0A640TQ56_STRNI|nr:hypothetical protein Sliba_57430 [Streptomyces libani subsp. libani]GGW06023.1 hypothetical protein GCM10010500_71600 [Streptomyces libani subsp. libani]